MALVHICDCCDEILRSEYISITSRLVVMKSDDMEYFPSESLELCHDCFNNFIRCLQKHGYLKRGDVEQ